MSSIVYNMDCMEGMKQYPDNYFDLAIVDPPYGAGLGEGGGCQGRFAKYREDNQPRNNGGNTKYWNRFGQRFDRYKHQQTGIPWKVLQPKSTSKEQTPNGTGSGLSRNGTSTKAKKSFRGMWRLNRSILKNCFASHVIRSYGGGITSICHQQDAS